VVGQGQRPHATFGGPGDQRGRSERAV
jgi:hypothetical protein